jgi:hypothetical protein
MPSSMTSSVGIICEIDEGILQNQCEELAMSLPISPPDFISDETFLNISPSDIICDDIIITNDTTNINISNKIIRIGILKEIKSFVELCKIEDSYKRYADKRKFNIIYCNMNIKKRSGGKGSKIKLIPLFLLLETKFKLNNQRFLRHKCEPKNMIAGRIQNNKVRIYIYIHTTFHNSFLLYI